MSVDKAHAAEVRRAARRVATAEAKLLLAIHEMHCQGASLREIAAAAGLSHTQIANMLRAVE